MCPPHQTAARICSRLAGLTPQVTGLRSGTKVDLSGKSSAQQPRNFVRSIGKGARPMPELRREKVGRHRPVDPAVAVVSKRGGR